MEQGSDYVGVIKVFKTNAAQSKKGKHNIPLILMVRLEKGAKPLYTSYKVMRQTQKELLLDYFQKRIVFRSLESQAKPFQQNLQIFDHPPGLIDFNRQLSKQQSLKGSRNKGQKRELKRQMPRQTSRQVSLSADSRPVRSCRFRNQLLKDKSREIRGYPIQKAQHQISQSVNQSQRESLAVENIRTTAHQQNKKILDYDFIIEEAGCLNLISPAVIPNIRPRHNDIVVAAAQVPYQLPARINFKELQREQYSSQEFKESEESQFLLDDRGKQKRRKQKMMREQQRLNRKRKNKRIKKKKKSNKA